MRKKRPNVEILFSAKSKRMAELFKKGMDNDEKLVSLANELERLGNAVEEPDREKKVEEIEMEIEKIKANNDKVEQELQRLSTEGTLENELLLRGKWPRERN